MSLQALLWLISALMCTVWIIPRLASYKVSKSCGFFYSITESLIEDVETIVFLKLSSLEEAINCFEQHNQPNPISIALESNLLLLHQRNFQMKNRVSMDFQKYTLLSRLCSGICYLLEYKRFKYSFKRLAKKSSLKAGCSCKLSQCEFNRIMAADRTFNRNIQICFKKIRSFVSECAIKYLIILIFLRAITSLTHKFSLYVESPNTVKLNLSETWSKTVLFLVFFIFCLQWKFILKWPFINIASLNKFEFMDNSMLIYKYPYPEKNNQLIEQKHTEAFNLEKRKESMKAFLEGLSGIRSKEEVKKDFTFEKVSLKTYIMDNESPYLNN
ncbi:hypothetical protein SOMG_01531 [Schizosaccharomyces osmophilus]|uniref:Uncharacterized protein n=1 Tax=Schizosaccharomyces osmophilus TaxID=2545709 RepID=A0AAF0AUE0_9SCHI|nr:uncharacterized protein SOMG_01531 [Schizosaccharomyces osmophilus]WBW70714.1 hypothetical protein SOMG_01531 [Schizosaccharomyces osmophilus]